jgi:hypothetical protein
MDDLQNPGLKGLFVVVICHPEFFAPVTLSEAKGLAVGSGQAPGRISSVGKGEIPRGVYPDGLASRLFSSFRVTARRAQKDNFNVFYFFNNLLSENHKKRETQGLCSSNPELPCITLCAVLLSGVCLFFA